MAQAKNKKQRREKGTGRVFRRKLKHSDGSVYYSKKYYLEYTVNGKKKTICLDCEKEREAQAKAKGILNPLKEANTRKQLADFKEEALNLVKKDNVKLIHVWELYLKNLARPDSGSRTLDCYQYMFKRFRVWIENNYSSLTNLSHITEDIALEYGEYLWASIMSAKTFNSHIGAIRLITKVLARQAGILANPWEVVAHKNEVKQSRKEFSEQEVIDILQVFDDSGFYLLNKLEMKIMFNFGAWTGLRLIDCALMQWDSIDLNRNLINCIPHKTQKNQRTVTIPIHPLLKKRLQDAIDWKKDEFVLPKVAERYVRNPSGVRKDAIKVIKHVGFETTQEVKGTPRAKRANIYGFHSFRHSFVSFCAKAGVPLPVVQSIVGHGNPAITRHYIHIGEDSVKQAINALPMAVEKQDSAEEKLIKVLHLMAGKKNLTKFDKEILEIIKSK